MPSLTRLICNPHHPTVYLKGTGVIRVTERNLQLRGILRHEHPPPLRFSSTVKLNFHSSRLLLSGRGLLLFRLPSLRHCSSLCLSHPGCGASSGKQKPARLGERLAKEESSEAGRAAERAGLSAAASPRAVQAGRSPPSPEGIDSPPDLSSSPPSRLGLSLSASPSTRKPLQRPRVSEGRPALYIYRQQQQQQPGIMVASGWGAIQRRQDRSHCAGGEESDRRQGLRLAREGQSLLLSSLPRGRQTDPPRLSVRLLAGKKRFCPSLGNISYYYTHTPAPSLILCQVFSFGPRRQKCKCESLGFG